MKYLGIDYGSKRIGIAVSDDGGRIAFPHVVVESGPSALSHIVAMCKEHAVGGVVVGESRDLSGEKNPLMEDIEQFAKDLHELSGVPVHFEPEFLTSAMASRQGQDKRGEGGVAKSDASAAALILQSFLDKKK